MRTSGIGGADMNYQLAQAMKVNVTYGVLIESVAERQPSIQRRPSRG